MGGNLSAEIPTAIAKASNENDEGPRTNGIVYASSKRCGGSIPRVDIREGNQSASSARCFSDQSRPCSPAGMFVMPPSAPHPTQLRHIVQYDRRTRTEAMPKFFGGVQRTAFEFDE